MPDVADHTEIETPEFLELYARLSPLLSPVEDLVKMPPPYFLRQNEIVMYFLAQEALIDKKIEALVEKLKVSDLNSYVNGDDLFGVLMKFLGAYNSDDLLNLLILLYGFSYFKNDLTQKGMYTTMLQVACIQLVTTRGVMKLEDIKKVTHVQQIKLHDIISTFSAALTTSSADLTASTTSSPLNRFIALTIVLAHTCVEFMKQVLLSFVLMLKQASVQLTTAAKASVKTFSAGLFDRSGYNAVDSAGCCTSRVAL